MLISFISGCNEFPEAPYLADLFTKKILRDLKEGNKVPRKTVYPLLILLKRRVTSTMSDSDKKKTKLIDLLDKTIDELYLK